MSVSTSTSSQNTQNTTRFAIVERLRSEYVADIFLAEDTHHGQHVILKTLPPEFTGSRDAMAQYHLDQFVEEARAATELSHPNIVKAYVGGDQQDPFVIMEYVEGASLADILHENGPFEADEIAFLGAQIAAALEFAHAKGRVHGGLSPENIFITNDNTVKVTDFGISLIRAYYGNPQDPTAELDAAGYHSPEHASDATIDASSDIYSFGAVLYAMATGGPPFSDDTVGAVHDKHLRRTPKRVSRINRFIPEALDEIIALALMKSPAERYDSAADIGNALLSLSNNQVLKREPAPLAREARESSEPRQSREPHQSREPRESHSQLSNINFDWLKHHSRTALGTVGTVAAGAAILLFFTVAHNPAMSNNPATQAFAAGLPTTTTVPRANYSVATPMLLPDVPAPTTTSSTTAKLPAAATLPAPAPAAAPKPATTTAPKPITTTTAKPAGQLPAPTGLQIALLQSNDVLLQWNAVTGATGYVAELVNANGATVFPAFDTNTTTANFGPLQPNTRYTALIWPSDAANIGGPGGNQPAATITFTNP